MTGILLLKTITSEKSSQANIISEYTQTSGEWQYKHKSDLHQISMFIQERSNEKENFNSLSLATNLLQC